MKKFFTIIILSFVFAASGTAQNKFYAGLKYVTSVSEDSDGDLRDSILIRRYRWFIGPDHSVQNADGVEMLFGYKPLNVVNLELSGSYTPGYVGRIRVTDVQNDYHQQDYRYTLYAISLNGLLVTNFSPEVEAYFKAGAGYMIRDRKVYGSVRVNMIINHHYIDYKDKFSSPFAKLGFGLKWYLLKNIPFVFEYENVKAYKKLNDVKNWNLSIGINYLL